MLLPQTPHQKKLIDKRVIDTRQNGRARTIPYKEMFDLDHKNKDISLHLSYSSFKAKSFIVSSF